MKQFFEVPERKWRLAPDGGAVSVGGLLATLQVAGVHVDHMKSVMVLSSVVMVTARVYSLYGGWRLMGKPADAALPNADHAGSAGQCEDALKREMWPQPAAAVSRGIETSPMEIRLLNTVKSIQDVAEQGLFASDPDQASRCIRTIWVLAASDLDEPERVAH